MQVSRPSSPNRQRSTRSATSEKIEKLVPAPSKDAPSGRACPGQTVTALIVPLRLRSPDPPYRCCQADAARPMLPGRCCQALPTLTYPDGTSPAHHHDFTRVSHGEPYLLVEALRFRCRERHNQEA